MAELRAYQPSLRDQIAWGIAGGLGKFGADKHRQKWVADKVGGIIDFVPGIGETLGVNDAWRDARAGNYGMAAAGLGLTALGLVPGAKIATKPLKKLASRSPNIYNPPMKSPRPFEADYPGGAVADDAGNLTRDIDGNPLTARYVVGRRIVSGPDVALPSEALDEIAKARTGEAIRSVAPRSPEIGRDVGRAVFRRGGSPDYIAVSNALKPEQSARVAAHEIGHVIDKTADEIPISGINDELRTIYNDLNNPQSHGRRFGPEQNRYRGGDVPRELMAEAIRAYMADPNYLKTVAPKTAARIRKYVNNHPQLKDIIQFNSLVGAGGVGLMGYGVAEDGAL